jgi:APA family basic amino acid/polyamine antiporter
MSGPESEPQAGKGQLGLWDAISIIVGIVIGTSIYQVPGLIFSNVSDPWTGLLVWAVGGLLALVGALCYAELATTYPRSGGDYVYLTRAFGRGAGFLFGWAQLVVVMPASIGAMAYVFAEFAVRLLDLSNQTAFDLPLEFVFATGAVMLLSLLNILGVVFGKTTQNVLSLAKVIGLAVIVVAGVMAAQTDALGPLPQARDIGWGALAMILVLYAYGGWNDTAFVAAEVRNQRRNIPLALILGVSGIVMIYLLVNAAYLLGLGFEGVRSARQVPAELVQRAFGQGGSTVMSLLVLVSALGAVNGLIFTGARVYATLGADYGLFAFLGRRWQPGKRAPVGALVAQLVITVGILVALGTAIGHQAINDLLVSLGVGGATAWEPGQAFQTLVNHTAPVFWLFFLLTGLSLFVLRDKNPAIPRPFSVPLYPVLPIIFCNTCAYMLYSSATYVGWRASFALALVALGVPLYLLCWLFGGIPDAPVRQTVPGVEAEGNGDFGRRERDFKAAHTRPGEPL